MALQAMELSRQRATAVRDALLARHKELRDRAHRDRGPRLGRAGEPAERPEPPRRSAVVHHRMSASTGLAALRRHKQLRDGRVSETLLTSASDVSVELPTMTWNSPGSTTCFMSLSQSAKASESSVKLTVVDGAGRERHALEAAQLLHRPRHRADHVAQVELHDFVAGHLAGVAHVDRHRHRAVRR